MASIYVSEIILYDTVLVDEFGLSHSLSLSLSLSLYQRIQHSLPLPRIHVLLTQIQQLLRLADIKIFTTVPWRLCSGKKKKI